MHVAQLVGKLNKRYFDLKFSYVYLVYSHVG
ncbi:Uncharacterised protein [Streptococcus pneumoniae]|nr:Uncharacterised protein [Streptococcus pneumoniae]CYI89173.1 Uncharacterised protein [Streptococcus pneumoniae]